MVFLLLLCFLSMLCVDAWSITKRDLLIPNNIYKNWSYSGCWTDNVPGRVLSGKSYADGQAMTDEACILFCDAKNYIWAGTEYSGECYCGNKLSDASIAVNMSQCDMPCSGNVSESCGGPNLLTLFNSGIAPPLGPYYNPGPGIWTSLGCYNETSAGRTLSNGISTPGGSTNLTVAKCTSTCLEQGFVLAGVEYAGECYCGNSLLNGGGPAPDGFAQCNMVCNGNSSEYCGGPNRLNMYTTLGWEYIGCYNDSVQARVLPYAPYILGGGDAMTVGNCTAACTANGYIYAGLEYAGECYCGNSILNGGVSQPSGGDETCAMPCNGDGAQTCGGPNRLSFYAYRGSVPIGVPSSPVTTNPTATTLLAASVVIYSTSSVAGASNSTTAFPSNVSVSAVASTVGSPASITVTTSSSSIAVQSTYPMLSIGWWYVGCYIDNTQGRIFQNRYDNEPSTVENCIAACANNNYAIAGLEYGSECYCDNYIRNNGTLTNESDCSMNCASSSAERCGNGNRVSVYANTVPQVYAPAAAQTVGLPGSWQYTGCLLDNGNPRTLPWQLILTDNNTANNCLSQCSSFGYNAGGMEYGEECYCGDIANVAQSAATMMPASDCNVLCTGNASYLCGGGNRLSYYTWTGPALNSWNFATGSSAGQYRFLIGGVVVPLVTSQSINGKVTFLEKHGTGPPNSTGAYELDIAEVNNFTAAWRQMDVKTDVFCSASLILPDKAGRQINIGGWSGASTFGIRFYWPDGTPTVAGVNDWQENYQEVSLMAGRWYPSGIVMANGSILVVGGERGSNDIPVPSLEILPAPAGATPLFCDWLSRTDPLNLYPFLAVLPSGGIFVAYYNEARILDEASLTTSRVLPNIPGSVNNFGAGRTYPLSGTMMLMPQYAPYSDPLTVLICGGSTTGAAIAIDNCVSVQPEVANPVWTLERMPSQRVIACMTALPDGTYLIMNGAMQGTAGFGLATMPNHNAVLYNPSAPVNQRMTVMANTTVSRLYHSESILLQDGRVLVSGSDPEDGTNPQEYRVEVFIPPYLLSGTPQPTFFIEVTDWAYGGSYQVTVGGSQTQPSPYVKNASMYQQSAVTSINPSSDAYINTTSTTNSSAIGANAKVRRNNYRASLLGAESSTHGNSMGQRTLFPAIVCMGQTCTITAPPNANVCPPGWYQLFILNGPTPSHSVYVRIGGDPASLGNWPNFSDFDVPGV